MLPSFLALPPEQLSLLRLVADEAVRRGLSVYIVGGFVRDLLLAHPSLDFDIVVEGDAPALARALAKKHGGKVTAHPKFGTAVWILDRRRWTMDGGLPPAVDLISSRRETYARPAALPDVTPSTIDDDIRRRDFTINTLAVRLDGEHFGELYDLFNGKADIERGLVRALHDASFFDDPTRLFRAVRYEQRYGFEIESQTLKWMDKARPLVAQLSAERARHELDLIFDEPRAVAMLARLDELGLLKAIADVLPWSANLRQRLDAALEAVPSPVWGFELPEAGIQLPPAGTSRRILGYSLWLLELSPAEIDSVQSRLVFPLTVYHAARAASQLRADLPTLSGEAPSGSDGGAPSKWVDRLGGVPLEAIYAVYLVSGEKALEAYAAHWRHIHPKTDGEALKALGIPPGPAYKKILLRLRAAWLDGEVASAEQEKSLLEKLLD
jgi:tRNA nucleotidyltransferase (CCA-adding enzyme)